MPTILLLALLVGMWVLIFLPQQRRMKAHQALVASVKEGDRVLLSSGVYGSVTEVLDSALYLEVAEGIEILVSRSQLAEIIEAFPTELPAQAEEE